MDIFRSLSIIFCLAIWVYSCSSENDDLGQKILEQEAKMEEVWESQSISPFSEEFQELIGGLIESYRIFSETYPDKPQSPEYLFKAANYTETYAQDSPGAIELYRQFREQYPEHDKAGDALFNIGWIYNNSFKDIENARKAYTAFIAEYPDHKQVESAKFEIEHLGMSEDEIFEQLDLKDSKANE